jgi:hypothetical protein
MQRNVPVVVLYGLDLASPYVASPKIQTGIVHRVVTITTWLVCVKP